MPDKQDKSHKEREEFMQQTRDFFHHIELRKSRKPKVRSSFADKWRSKSK